MTHGNGLPLTEKRLKVGQLDATGIHLFSGPSSRKYCAAPRILSEPKEPSNHSLHDYTFLLFLFGWLVGRSMDAWAGPSVGRSLGWLVGWLVADVTFGHFAMRSSHVSTHPPLSPPRCHVVGMCVSRPRTWEPYAFCPPSIIDRPNQISQG